MENVKKIRDTYPNYNKINFASVYDFKTDLIQNDIFFSERKDLPLVGFISQVADSNTDYYSRFNEEDHVAFSKA